MSTFSLKQAVITAAITLIAGVVLFGISEFAKGIFIMPIIKLREHKALIIDRVIFYADKILNPVQVSQADNEAFQKTKDMKEHLRSAATQYLAKSQAVPCYRLWSFLRAVPKKEDINTVFTNLIAIQNSVMPTDRNAVTRFADRNLERYDKLKEVLKLPEG